MKAPKIPSFFKSSKIKHFSFKPRYYDKIKERHKQLNQIKKNIKFKNIYAIILSLLAHKIITN